MLPAGLASTSARAKRLPGPRETAENRDGGAAELVIARFAAAGVDVDALAARLQKEGADSFVESWDELIDNIGEKASALTAAA